MQRSVAVAVLALVVTSAVLAGPTGATTTERSAFSQPQGFDETTFEITVYDNASARWTFEHRKALNDSQVSQFRDYAREFENNRTDLYASFVNRTYALTAAGTNATGRNMTALAHSRSASVEHSVTQRQGVVRLSFIWTNFAVESGERVTIGDVFEGGIPIGADQRLVVHPGPNLAFANATPDDYVLSGETLATSDSITWFGERRFADERPHVEFLPSGAIGDGPATRDTNAGTTQGAGGPDEQESSPVMFAGLLLIVAVLAAGLAYQRGVFDRLPTGDGTAGAETTDESDGAGAAPEPEVVSDRDRVKELLSDNGGRMKQVRIVDETDWSKSKVSMLLSEMEDDGEISKLRVGRENIVSLSGHEPDAAGSPFDDE